MMILLPGSGLMPRMIGAIVAAFVGTMIFFLFLRRVSLSSSLIVPIVGIMLGAVVGSITTYLALATDMLQSLGRVVRRQLHLRPAGTVRGALDRRRSSRWRCSWSPTASRWPAWAKT